MFYVVDISGYGTITDEGRNAMIESLEVLEEINQEKFLKGATMLLLFNKYDLFRRTVTAVPLTE